MEVRRQNNQEIDEQDKKEKLAKLYNVLIENKDIKDYFDYEISFNKMMYDINKIIGDTIKDVLWRIIIDKKRIIINKKTHYNRKKMCYDRENDRNSAMSIFK